MDPSVLHSEILWYLRLHSASTLAALARRRLAHPVSHSAKPGLWESQGHELPSETSEKGHIPVHSEKLIPDHLQGQQQQAQKDWRIPAFEAQRARNRGNLCWNMMRLLCNIESPTQCIPAAQCFVAQDNDLYGSASSVIVPASQLILL